MGGEEGFEQTRFLEGEVVSGASAESSVESITALLESLLSDAPSGFRVLVREGARDANSWVSEFEAEYGDVWRFESRADAERLVSVLSEVGGGLRVQAVPENESREIEAYLLAGYSPSTTEPASVVDGTWSFDVGANLYGSLGEAVVLSGPPYPALETYVSGEFGLDRETFTLEVCRDVDEVRAERVGDRTETWVPDCDVVVRDRDTGRERARFLGEVKTGSASFQRSQATVMEATARSERVLKIRVTIESLPASYSVRITAVEP